MNGPIGVWCHDRFMDLMRGYHPGRYEGLVYWSVSYYVCYTCGRVQVITEGSGVSPEKWGK
jgi:hypothetical protein